MNLNKLRSALVWLTMAAFCGLIGFVIVYHYAKYARPIERFAIVVDAGSTQTRSSLFSIEFDGQKLSNWMDKLNDERGEEEEDSLPLAHIVRVRQISSCINGGPLASIGGLQEAQQLIGNCLLNFTQQIKQLNFNNDDGDGNIEENEEENIILDGQQDNRARMVLNGNRRVNSVTHLYLGATAGMRALRALNETKALQKMHWIDEAISGSNRLLLPIGSPYVNKAYSSIISGQQEATFGWISVNFLTEKLAIKSNDNLIENFNSRANKKSTLYETINESLDLEAHENKLRQIIKSDIPKSQEKFPSTSSPLAETIGTLELGGASAQLAFQVDLRNNNNYQEIIDNNNNTEQLELNYNQLDLFGRKYELATRSDLCLGMSQAVLRVEHLLLRKHFSSANLNTNQTQIALNNVCMHRGSRIELKQTELAQHLNGAACLMSAHINSSENELVFRKQLKTIEKVSLFGEGNVEQCADLLKHLIEPQLCKEHFLLCPQNKFTSNKNSLPSKMPFVTISGYNHAMNVLDLEAKISSPKSQSGNTEMLETIIENKLGGYSIDYEQFLLKTKQFCQTQINDLPQKYPKVKKQYEAIVCLQLVYIEKLLTNFYEFKPTEASWEQVKFLIFKPGQIEEATSNNLNNKQRQPIPDLKRDIGWTLGLLLNATSNQFDLQQNNFNFNQSEAILFRHGSSLAYIMRSTIFLMFACCLIAIALLVVGIVEVRRAQNSSIAYINHDYYHYFDQQQQVSNSNSNPNNNNNDCSRFYTIDSNHYVSVNNSGSYNEIDINAGQHERNSQRVNRNQKSFAPKLQSYTNNQYVMKIP